MPADVKEDVAQASSELKKIIAPNANTSVEVRDVAEKTIEPLTQALKIIQDPHTTPRDRETIAKIVKQLKIIVIESPKAHSLDWRGIAAIVEQLRIVIIEFPKAPPQVRHDIEKIIGPVTDWLEMVHDPKMPREKRDIVGRTVEPMSGAIKIIQSPGKSPGVHEAAERAVKRLVRALEAVRNSKQDDKELYQEKKEEVDRVVIELKKQQCSQVEIIYMPGTFDFTAGAWVTPALEKQLAPLKTNTWQPSAEEYPANLTLPGSVQDGNRALVAHMEEKVKLCGPTQQFVLIGYSQGANVVQNALGGDTGGALVGAAPVAKISSAIGLRIRSVVFFGNPSRTPGGIPKVSPDYAGRTLDICAPGDPLCAAPPAAPADWIGLSNHFTDKYAKNVGEVAKCIKGEPGCDKEKLRGRQ
ncbi:cutinase family protein [Streptomyces sp. Ru71]|uniref:cutinase family protein n=1 Tax=Streptomyces sp. Ru71 TaxID=2080746 RepID=UPI0011B081A5|nr:cutinase family protein [Streptomyces sp. Ru71]